MQANHTTKLDRSPGPLVVVGLVSVMPVLACSGGDDALLPGTLGIRYEDVGLCSIPDGQIYSGGVGRDGIPALSDPALVGATDSAAPYLYPDDRVIGIEVGGEYIAIPHNILWHHEIVNFNNNLTTDCGILDARDTTWHGGQHRCASRCKNVNTVMTASSRVAVGAEDAQDRSGVPPF